MYGQGVRGCCDIPVTHSVTCTGRFSGLSCDPIEPRGSSEESEGCDLRRTTPVVAGFEGRGQKYRREYISGFVEFA